MEKDKGILRFVFMNGRGSSGKDTQAGLLVERNPKAVSISTGDLCRGAQTPDGVYGRFYPLMKPFIEQNNSGGYIPDGVMFQMATQVIGEHIAAGKTEIILPGFPRTMGQLKAVDAYLEQLESQGYKTDAYFLCYSVLPQLSVLRAKLRRNEAILQGVPIREDDRPEKIDRRLFTFQDQTVPMLRHLLKNGRLEVIKSNGDIQEVHLRTLRALEKEILMAA